MPEVLITMGLPGSGKSTWARNKVKHSNGAWKRVNKDDLRAMIDDGTFSTSNEKTILKVRDQMILAFLRQGCNVIVDDTNIHPKHERHIRAMVPHDTKVSAMSFMNVSVETCIERDAQRTGTAHVGEDVIRRFAADWERYKDADRSIPEGMVEEIPWDDSLPIAYIFDLDGTLAHMHNRSPYDWKKCIDDHADDAVRRVAWALKSEGAKIIIMSGRDSVCREETLTWLEMHAVPYDLLIMRAENDSRKDSIVKRELFDASVRGKFNIVCVFDDRNQVVEEWRQMGLKCFQVAEGNF